MKLRINKIPIGKNTGDYRCYIACGVRFDAKKTGTKNLVFLGKYSDLAKQYPDVEAYLQNMRDKEQEKYPDHQTKITKVLTQNKPLKNGDNKYYCSGSLFIKRIYDSLKLDECFANIKNNSRIKYDLSDAMLSLITFRILSPGSKINMFNTATNSDIIEHSINLQHVFRGLKKLEDNRLEVLRHCYNQTIDDIERDKTILYYDVTKTYFETEIEDNLRKRGKGKRNEVEPLVSFGLALDGTGIPLTYVVYDGASNEQPTLIPLEKEIIRDFRQSRLVVITDAGLCSVGNRAFNSIGNRRFITTLPIRTMSEEKQSMFIFDEKKEWVTTDTRYKTPKVIISAYDSLMARLECRNIALCEQTMIYREIERLKNITLYRRYPVLIDKKPQDYLTIEEKTIIKKAKQNKEEAPEAYLNEDYLISFNLGYLLRERRKRNKLVEKAASFISKDNKLKKKYSATDPRSFLSMSSVDENGESKELHVTINQEKIRKDEKLDGYYCVTTNLIDDDNETIIKAMKFRWFIEDSFEVMKQNFNFRPVRHWTEKMIKAHFFQCFLTLFVYRFIQLKCWKSDYDTLKGISNNELIYTLKRFGMLCSQGKYYEPAIKDGIDQTILDLQNLFNVSLTNEVYLKKDLNKEIFKK